MGERSGMSRTLAAAPSSASPCLSTVPNNGAEDSAHSGSSLERAKPCCEERSDVAISHTFGGQRLHAFGAQPADTQPKTLGTNVPKVLLWWLIYPYLQ